MVYLDRVEAQWPLGLRFEPGSRVPLHCTAIGKMFLSHMPEQQRKEFVQTITLRRYTGNTITDQEALLVELRRNQEAGIATDKQEFMSGVVGGAAPIPEAEEGSVGDGGGGR